MQTHSLIQAAALLGLNRSTLQTWLAQGCPAVERGDRGTGTAWKIALGDVLTWRVEKAVSDTAAAFTPDSSGVTREEADRRRAVAQAHLVEIELDERLGTVVACADVKADVTAFALTLKQQLGSASNRIAARATTITSAPEIEDMVQAELNKAFTSARSALARRWADVPG